MLETTTQNDNENNAVAAEKLDVEALRPKVVEMIKQVYDPEIPVNIYDLGLIYEVRINETGDVHVMMTLTAPSCPSAQSLPLYVQRQIETVQGVKSAKVEITWDPPWDKSMMSEEAQLELGFL